jgi:histidinol-phosphatase
MLVAQGAVDVAVDAIGLEPYDIAALVPIVQAAGGHMVDQSGEMNWQGNTSITTNAALHNAVKSTLLNT